VTRILGIDPGSVITGLGVIDVDANRTRHVHHAMIRAGKGPFPERLRIIFDGVSAAIHEYQPQEVAIESVFVSKNADSALKLGQARGAAICAAVAMNLTVAEYAPRQVKQAVVGRGSADKVQIQHMVAILLGIDNNIQADAADALGVAVTHAHHQQTAERLGTATGAWR
jgi:crossover junction endodeoxyribonuclease RuvC